MKSHVLRAVLLACLLATAARKGRADAGSFFNNLGNTFVNAGETIAHGTQAAYSTVKNDTVNAAQATGSAFKQAGEAVAGAAKDVYSQSVQFARQEWNGTERAINTVEGALQNVTSDLNETVVQFKTSALSGMKPAWEDVQRAADSFANTSLAVASQGVSGAVHFGNEKWTALQAAPGPAAALTPVGAPSQDGVDVTNSVSLLAAAGSNSSAQFTAAARSIIVAIAANRSADVASAVGAVVITADAANNTQVPLGLSEAFATAMLAADKAFADHTAAVTPTTAASTFIEGLQAAVANCTSGLQTNLQPRSAGWYKFYASRCCSQVAPTVGDMSLIMQQVPSDTVANAWFDQMSSTYQYGLQPSFDLARCLAENQDIVNLNVS
ncbi:hypothetical protein CVIRNUC_006955 [Coccomyxa viridis]|uniref:Uncharacterized protein n=1 Tax=Coccomyxa viridis TaxID=1274662 RepID=A0AAV1IAK0_9CHLO|nr:hypothetical protein CVIRNUC_006955 [Coccomyxa viridis]